MQKSKTFPKPTSKPRLETLDHLRGFFIIVIIIDHLSRWPSALSLLTGKAMLLVTAAEGFVAISGLLVGYVRGFKNRALPLKTVSFMLLRRAALLYVWSLIASIGYVAIIWYVPLQGGAPSTPMAVGDWQAFLIQLVTFEYTFVWVYFLTLYALFLATAPIAIWLLRRKQAWVVGVLTTTILIVGWITKIEVLQWQFLFFSAVIIGYYLETIMEWWQKLSRSSRRKIAITTVAATVLTMVISALLVFWDPLFGFFINNVDDLFAKDSISPLRAGMAFLWFTGLFFVFYQFRRVISRYFNWLLLPFGRQSLTAYILHGLVLCMISFFTVSSLNGVENTALGLIAILIVLGLIKLPFIRKIIPA
ncbi:OpgC domain-containing protein [Candidatus Saccharibacteria bacterium]|nr:OpgC domain-containing protein [Candidatus Saccharibacteria bacterium]